MKPCLLLIDIQESFRQRPYFSERDLPAYLAAQNALIEGCVARGVPVVRWLYEFGAGRLFVSTPDLALPGRTAFVEETAALTARWRQHQGAGPLAAAWYELGAQGPHLFSWQTTRWENALLPP